MRPLPQDSTIYPTNSKHVIYPGATVIYDGKIAVVHEVRDGEVELILRDGSHEVVKRG